MDKSAKKKLLEHIEVMLEIPEIERLLYHKIEELRELFKDRIEDYLKNRTESEPSSRKSELRVVSENYIIPQSTYSFELKRLSKQKWRVAHLSPAPPADSSEEDILPLKIIRFLATYPTSPFVFHTISSIRHPKRKDLRLHLRFSRYSYSKIMGSVSRVAVREIPVANDDKTAESVIHVEDKFCKTSFMGNFSDLRQYMDRFPYFQEFIISEFFMKWKPLLDHQLMKMS